MEKKIVRVLASLLVLVFTPLATMGATWFLLGAINMAYQGREFGVSCIECSTKTIMSENAAVIIIIITGALALFAVFYGITTKRLYAMMGE